MYHLREQFRTFDLFGQPIRLNFNGSNQYRTATGGILTIIIVALVILFFQSNIILFLQKQNLTALTQTTFEEDPPRVFMNDTQYMFAIRLKQDNFTTRPYFNLTTLFRTTQRLQNGTSVRTNRNVNLIPCTKERFTKLFDKKGINITQQLINLNIEDWLCPDYNFTIFIGGRFTSEYFDFVRFGIFRCSNNSANNSFFTWKPVCATTTQMSNFIKINSVYTVQVAMINWQINPQKPEDYIQMYLDSSFYYNFLPNQLLRETNIFFKPYTLLTDNSLVPAFTDIANETYLVRESQDYRDIVAIGSVSDTQFSTLYFRRSPFTKTINRQFQQVDNLLSYLGGFINTIVIMLGFFVAYYNRQQYIIELSNRIYSFERQKQISEPIESKQKQMKNSEISQVDYNRPAISVKSPSNKEINSIQYKPEESIDVRNKSMSVVEKSNNLIQLIPIDFEKQESSSILKKKLFSENMELQDQKIYLAKQIYQILKKGMPIKFDVRFIFNQITCNYLFKTPEVQLIEKAQDRINHDLDVYILLEKVSQINLLKELVLNKDQQILFNFAPKPIIRAKDLHHEIKSRIDMHISPTRMRKSLSPSNSFNLNNLASQIQSYDKELEFETELNVYNQLFKAYDKIVQQDTQDSKNKVLFSKLGPQILEIFEISLMIEFDKTPVVPQQVQRIITKRKSRIEQKQSKVSNEGSVESESAQKIDLSRATSLVFNEQRKPKK